MKQKLWHAVDDLFSAKFFVLVASTVLLYTGKLSENNWVMIAMMVAGLKEASNIAYTLKGGTKLETSVAPVRGKSK